MRPKTVHLIAAARPNFMKVAPVYNALLGCDWCAPVLIHTGQHYDPNMSGAFFRDLGLPEPAFRLGVGSGTHAEQTAGVMTAYESICLQERPDWTIVVGDVNSTLAAALVCAKLGIPFAHLEAGLRSRDRSMPEEINRIVTDQLADLLWTPSPDGDENLIAEGIPAERIERVGNIMIDAYVMLRDQIEAERSAEKLELERHGYGVVTLHRPANVDTAENLRTCIGELIAASARIPLVFPVHPRTRRRMEEFGILQDAQDAAGLKMTEPLGYIEFLSLVSDARLAITDSGGLQEETTYLGIPCITVRDSTERPITVTNGTNRLARPDEIGSLVEDILAGRWKETSSLELWDGQTAGRVADSLAKHLESSGDGDSAIRSD